MPITWPFILNNAPPELPGLIAASVWIHSLLYPIDDETGRSRADTIPVVTLFINLLPPGHPITTTCSPTTILLLSANSATLSPVALIERTPISV